MSTPNVVVSSSPVGNLARLLTALVLFGVSFGYVEAALVSYLRAIYDPIRQELYPGKEADQLFPLITLEDLQAAGPDHVRRLVTELFRELATIVMLAAAALAVARNTAQWFAGFMIVFGVWDIFYYVFLKVLLDWPESLFTWDILFLVPVPWVGPVLAPVLVSLTMISAGLTIFWREAQGRPLRAGWRIWTAALLGGLIVIVAFCWDFRNTAAGGHPNPFNWFLFLLGEGIGLGGLYSALRPPEKT